jgi:serine/threonine protein phosphatase PrpC
MGGAQSATMQARLLFRSASRTHAGAIRPTNEDALLARDDLGFWAVSDGMGGHAGGGIASAAVIAALARLGGTSAALPLEREAGAALTRANAELCDRNETRTPPTEMGATVAALGMEGSRFFCLWAGDSRIYRLRGAGLTQLTRDHRYVQELIDAGALSESQAQHHPQRNVITRAVGVARDLSFDRRDGDAAAGDIFLLATDGVSAVCTNADIARLMAEGSPEDAADRLANLCLDRGAPDNFALVLVAASAAP